MNLEELMASTPPMQQHALINGFQAGAASRDAEVAQWQKIIDEEAKDSALVIIERDQLRAQINVLLKALQLTQDQAIRGRTFPATASPSAWFNAVTIALASTTEQALAEYRNKVIEECAVKLDPCVPIWAKEVRAMKEQP